MALKTLPRLSAGEATQLRREARAMASVEHPHLASIYGAESWRGAPVLVLEHLPGGTLADRVAAGDDPGRARRHARDAPSRRRCATSTAWACCTAT